METEIVRGDKSLRIKTALALVLFALAMMACYYYFFGGIQDLIAGGSEAEILARLRQIRWLTLGMVAASVVAAVYVLYIGARVLRCHRFPPPGMRVTRDTPVRTGASAHLIGWLIIGTSLLLVAASAWVHFLLLHLIASLPS